MESDQSHDVYRNANNISFCQPWKTCSLALACQTLGLKRAFFLYLPYSILFLYPTLLTCIISSLAHTVTIYSPCTLHVYILSRITLITE